MLLTRGRVGLTQRPFELLNNAAISRFICSDATVCMENNKWDVDDFICVSSDSTDEFFVTVITNIRTYADITTCLGTLSDDEVSSVMPWVQRDVEYLRNTIPKSSEFMLTGHVYIIDIIPPDSGDVRFFI